MHDCRVGQDDNAQRVCGRILNLWVSDWLLLDSQPVPPREDFLFIIADAGGVGRLTEWQKTGMTQKPLASLERLLRDQSLVAAALPLQKEAPTSSPVRVLPPLPAARGAPAPRRPQTRVQKVVLTLQRSVLVKEVHPRRLLLHMAIGVMRDCLSLGDCAWGILFT